MAEPTIEELQQQIRDLQKLVRPTYTPFDGPEYSFPSLGQGISMREYQLMSLGQANGIIHGDNGELNTSPDSTGYRYYLDGHSTEAETNRQNTLILRAGTSAEAIIEGFYHRLTEDMEISFPPVSSPTTYYVCLTYDPESEGDLQGPVSVQKYSSAPPTSKGRVHLILHTVERRPNQLLTEATVTRYRPYTAGVVSVQNINQLPDVESYPAGTLAVPSSTGGQGVFVRSNTNPREWLDTQVGHWQNLEISQNLGLSGTAIFRRRSGGIDIYLHLEADSGPTSSYIASFPESSGIQFKRNWYMAYAGAGDLTGVIFNNSQYNPRRIVANGPRYIRFSGTIPDYVLNGL